MILKQTGKDVPRATFERGVLTATGRALFPAVHATAISLREQRIEYAVVDHGMTAEQQQTLEQLGVRLFQDSAGVPIKAALCTTFRNIPLHAWRKPYICWASPFKQTCWIDADAIPLAYSHELFQYTRGFVTFDHFVDGAFAEEHSRPLIEELGSNPPSPDHLQINAGVLGFNHGSTWISHWCATSNVILQSRRLLQLAPCRDQNALIAALAALQKRLPAPVLLRQSHWNYPADGLRNTEAERRLDYPSDGRQLLDFARERHPGVTVVHWMGHIKPWMLKE